MRAVQLRADVHRQVEGPHGFEASLRLRERHREIAAETYECLRPPLDDGQYRCERIMAMSLRGLETEHAFDRLQERFSGLLGDADRAVPLHVGMAPQWADSRTRLAEIPAQQQQVGDLL